MKIEISPIAEGTGYRVKLTELLKSDYIKADPIITSPILFNIFDAVHWTMRKLISLHMIKWYERNRR